jgi:hypothetical protein
MTDDCDVPHAGGEDDEVEYDDANLTDAEFPPWLAQHRKAAPAPEAGRRDLSDAENKALRAITGAKGGCPTTERLNAAGVRTETLRELGRKGWLKSWDIAEQMRELKGKDRERYRELRREGLGDLRPWKPDRRLRWCLTTWGAQQASLMLVDRKVVRYESVESDAAPRVAHGDRKRPRKHRHVVPVEGWEPRWARAVKLAVKEAPRGNDTGPAFRRVPAQHRLREEARRDYATRERFVISLPESARPDHESVNAALKAELDANDAPPERLRGGLDPDGPHFRAPRDYAGHGIRSRARSKSRAKKCT